MWMWILISLVVVVVLAVVAAVIFVNAMGSAFNIFNAHSHSVDLLRWPDGWWPKKKAVRRWPLSYKCMEPAAHNKPAPELTLIEMEKVVAAFSERAEATYAAHKGPKPEYADEYLAEARSARLKAAEQRQRGKELDAWSSYNDVCSNYESLLERLKPPA